MSMGNDNIVFLEVIEWFDDTGQELVHRVPENGSGEIKFGAQLTVRESQSAVFFYNGKACDAFGPGRHTLTTANIPIITKILALPWGMTSPLRAEVYFANMKIFPNLKWGTRDPVAFKDQELGLIRLRAHGIFNIRIIQPVLFINTMVGTMQRMSTAEIASYLKRVIISRFNDLLGEKLDTIFNLPGRYEELSESLLTILQKDFSHFGLALSQLYITSITPPPEVQTTIDDKSRLGIVADLDRLVQLKAASAMEKAAEANGGSGNPMGLGLGLMLPAIFSDLLRGQTGANGKSGQVPGVAKTACPDCRHTVPADSRFCPFCGHQIVIFSQCGYCFKNIPPNAMFCPKCGHSTAENIKPITCAGCGTENLPDSMFCNNCGEKLA
jgi:membrane protease subunit (stomatin/prohibitin family)